MIRAGQEGGRRTSQVIRGLIMGVIRILPLLMYTMGISPAPSEPQLPGLQVSLQGVRLCVISP